MVFFVEVDGEVIEIEFHERIFEKVYYPLYCKMGGEFQQTNLGTYMWADKKEELPVSSSSPPLLDKAHNTQQLFEMNKKEIEQLYLDAIGSGNYEKIDTNKVKIVLADLSKLQCWGDNEKGINRWIIFDETEKPNLVDKLNEAIRRDYKAI